MMIAGSVHAGSLSHCHDLLGLRAIVSVICNTCSFPTVTSQTVCCKKDLRGQIG